MGKWSYGLIESGRAWPWPGVHSPLSSQEVWPGPLVKILSLLVFLSVFVVVDVNNKRISNPSIDSRIFHFWREE